MSEVGQICKEDLGGKIEDNPCHLIGFKVVQISSKNLSIGQTQLCSKQVNVAWAFVFFTQLLVFLLAIKHTILLSAAVRNWNMWTRRMS